MATEMEYVLNIYGKDIKLDEFKLDDIPDILYRWELGGITDPLGQLSSFVIDTINDTINSLSQDVWNWLTTIKDNIIGAVTGAIDAVSSTIQGLISDLQNIVNNIAQSVSDLANQLGNAVTSIQNAISGIASQISGIVSSITDVINNAVSSITDFIGQAISGIQNAISGIASTIGSIVTQVSQTISTFASNIIGSIQSALGEIQGVIQNIANTLSSIAGQILSAIGNIPNAIMGAFEGFRQWLSRAFQTISSVLSNVTTTISSFFGQIQQFLGQLPTNIIEGIKGLLQTIGNAIDGVKQFFTEKLNSILQGVKDVGMALSGFINPLVEIKNFIWTSFKNFIDGITSFITDVKDKLISYLSDLPEKISDLAKSIGSIGSPSDLLKGAWDWIAENIPKAVIDAFNTIVGLVKGAFEAIYEAVLGVGKFIAGLIAKACEGLLDFTEELGSQVFKVFESFLSDPIVNLVKNISSTIKSKFPTLAKSGRGGELEVFAIVTPALVGTLALNRFTVGFLLSLGKQLDFEQSFGLPGTNIKWKFNPGWFIMEIGSALSEINKELVKGVAYGLCIWMSEPYRRAMNAIVRNWLPVELPSISEMLEILRRSSVSNFYNDMFNKVQTFLAYYGYADDVVDWIIAPLNEKTTVATVTDRFNRKVAIPLSLFYQLPTPSELCRMMVHDIFKTPNDFITVMNTRGYTKDLALMFYLLHFRYPSLEKLWEFACRCTAGMAWVTTQPIQESGLGYPGVSPVQLNQNVQNAEQAKQALNNFINNFLIHYAKWHDYAPFCWVQNFTSDRLIMLDLMADIPQRIDARWMYKWSIIEDKDLFKIVVARGLHPDWVEKITVAEAMNALAEERTFARTGVLNVFKEGFATEKALNETLSKLTTVKIMGKDWVVKFLPGEVKLLALRAKYDRAIDILRDYSRDLIRSYTDNVVKWNYVLDSLSKSISKIKNDLGINLELDKTYFELYKPVADSLKAIYTTNRIRTWLRYMMFRILERFARGYISEDEVNKYIDELVETGKLTDEEKELLKDIANMMLELFIRVNKAEAILKRLSRGIISVDEAKKELMKLGLSEDMAETLIEAKGKVYAFSVDKLISMSEYVPIDIKKVVERAKNLGYPEDEVKLLPAYKLARDLNEEIGRCVTELINDYVYGLIDDKQLEKEIDDLRTLWGEVKKYGVDWIVIDDNEKKLLIQLAKWRRERHLAREKANLSR